MCGNWTVLLLGVELDVLSIIQCFPTEPQLWARPGARRTKLLSKPRNRAGHRRKGDFTRAR